MPSHTTHGGRRAPQPGFWGPVAVIAAAQFLVIMTNAIITIALPRLAADLQMPAAQRSWAVTAYLRSFGSLLLIGGRVADSLGHRRAFLVGLLGTALMAAGAGCAPTGAWFLAFRAGQGAAAALLSPAALALVSTTFPDPTRCTRAYGVYGAVTGAGAAVGLLAGGVLTDLGTWRWTMFLTVPVALLSAAGGVLLLAPSAAVRRRPWRAAPVVLLVVTVFSFLFVVSEAATASRWVLLLAALVGVVSAAVLVALERAGEDPLLPVRVFRSRTRLAGLTAVGGLGPTGIFGLLSVQRQERMGMDPLQAGWRRCPIPWG